MAPKKRAADRKQKRGSLLSRLAVLTAAFIAVAAAGVGALLKYPLEPVPLAQTGSAHVLADGRSLSYQLRGDPNAQYTVLYLHRSASSRLEAAMLSDAVLRENSMRVLSVDRPGYGASTPHPGRDLATFAGDVEQLAVALKLHKVVVVGTSVGATYALALAAYSPDRVQALLLISPSGSTLDLAAEELAEFKADAAFPGSKYPVNGLFRRLVQHPKGAQALRTFTQAPLASRLGYHLLLAPLLKNVTAKIDPADQQCIMETQPQVLAAYVEGLAQRSAAPWIEDITLTLQPLPFNVSEVIPADMQGRITILASRQDATVPDVFAKSLKRRLPGAHLRQVDTPGHIGFFACQPALQQQVLADVLKSSCRDDAAHAASCPGWAAAHQCSINPSFMLAHCRKSCSACQYLPSDIVKVTNAACTDSDASCPGWAQGGECQKNVAWMTQNCRSSCHMCHGLRD